MNSDPLEHLQDLLAGALERPAHERAAFLEDACGGDAALRAEAGSLLAHQPVAEAFLEAPAYSLVDGELDNPRAGELGPGDALGGCRILALLGEGGMGEVYLAEDTKLERRVAVKLLKRRLDDASLARSFRHERKVLAALTHPGIARLYDGGTTPEGHSYLVMEYVDGERLDHFCEARGLGVGERLALFRKVCAAVAYAHQNLVVHRDLKPANIRVTPEGEPKLLDFGIAKLLDPEGTVNADQTVTLHGAMTPEYASPEQIKGEAISTASDVYSLGVILYELLTGQRPHALKNRRPDELARAICEEEPPRPSTVASRAPSTAATRTAPGGREPAARLHRLLEGDLDNIVTKALRKEPSRRYAGAAMLSEDILRHSEGLPVRARRDTLAYRAGKFVQRNKVSVVAGVLVFLALVAGLIVSTWQARVAWRERDRAHLAQRQAERLNGFLGELLGSADASHSGKDEKVSDVLDAASRNLDRELAGEPEVLVQAHETLCRSYHQLGLYVPAEQHARAALTLVRGLHGTDDPAAAKAEVTLADVLEGRYQWDEVEPLLRHALGVLRRQAVPDEAVLAEALTALGFCSYGHGHADRAEPFVLEALTHARAAWGEQSTGYAHVLNGLGNVKQGQRDYAAAESIYRRLVALQDQLAPDGEHSMTALLDLSIDLFNQEKFAEARQALDRLERDSQRLFGEKSLYYAFAIYGHGVLDATEGNCQAAIPLLRQVLPVLTAIYPPGQTTVVQCRAELGLCLTRAGQAAEGEPLLRAALADGTGVNRQDFAHTLGNLETALGECLLAQGRYPEAEGPLLAGHDDLEKRLGPQNRLTSQARRRLHDFYTAWNKPEQAARYAPEPNVASPPAQPSSSR